MTMGTFLALLGAALATIFAGIGSARGGGMAGEGGMGLPAYRVRRFAFGYFAGQSGSRGYLPFCKGRKRVPEGARFHHTR